MFKQVIIIRKDLKMRRGKEVAQGAHASLGAYRAASQEAIDTWLNGFNGTKICVTVNSEEELLQIHEQGRRANLPVYLVLDAAKTEFNQPEFTSVAIGPADETLINTITGNLKLY